MVERTRELHAVLQLVSSVWGTRMDALTFTLWGFAVGFFAAVINGPMVRGMTASPETMATMPGDPQVAFSVFCVIGLVIPV